MSMYRIARCNVKFNPKYSLMKDRLKTYQINNQKDEYQEQIEIRLTEEFLSEQQSKYKHLTIAECEYVWAGIQFYENLLNFNGFMLHSSAVEVDDSAYLFSANVGVGKSTHAKLWQQLLGKEKAIILNDDKPAICVKNEECYAYGTPFSGKSSEHLNKGTKIRAICMIERGTENEIWKISKKESITLIMQQTIWPKEEEKAEKLLSLLSIVLEKIPVFKMKCNISLDAAKMAYETMRKEK